MSFIWVHDSRSCPRAAQGVEIAPSISSSPTFPEVLIGLLAALVSGPADFPTLLTLLSLQGALWRGAGVSSFGVAR